MKGDIMEFVLAASTITTYLSKQWDTFISNLGLFAAIAILLYFVLKKTIEHGFQRQLTRLKGDVDHEVQSKIENLRIDHQKVLLNFETFNSNKNERYPQLYYLTEHALGLITYLRSIESFPTFLDETEEDVKTYCEVQEMNTGDINRILALWGQDKVKAISEISRLKKRIDYKRAEVKWHEANNYLLYNELYFSEEVTDQTRKLLDLMHQYWFFSDPIFGDMPIRKKPSGIQMELDEQRKAWKAIMKKEVSG